MLARLFAIRERLLPNRPVFRKWGARLSLEYVLGTALVMMLAGAGLLIWATAMWQQTGFGRLDYAQTMRVVIPGTALIALGVQTVLFAFLASILCIPRR